MGGQRVLSRGARGGNIKSQKQGGAGRGGKGRSRVCAAGACRRGTALLGPSCAAQEVISKGSIGREVAAEGRAYARANTGEWVGGQKAMPKDDGATG
jgi:hypothetical protein